MTALTIAATFLAAFLGAATPFIIGGVRGEVRRRQEKRAAKRRQRPPVEVIIEAHTEEFTANLAEACRRTGRLGDMLQPPCVHGKRWRDCGVCYFEPLPYDAADPLAKYMQGHRVMSSEEFAETMAALKNPDYLARLAADHAAANVVEVDNPFRREVRPRRGTNEPDPLTDTVTPTPLDESPMFHQVVASEGETP